MPLNIPATTVPADGSYVSIALGSLYSSGYLLLTGNVDMIMLYAPLHGTGQQQEVAYPNLPGGQYSLAPGTKNLITGFMLRAPGGALASTVQYSLAVNEPTIPSIIPAGGGASGPFRSGGGLQYAGANPVYGAANSGESLDITTAGTNASTGWGAQLDDQGGGGIQLEVTAGGGFNLVNGGGNGALQLNNSAVGGIEILDRSAAGITIAENSSGPIGIGNQNAGIQILTGVGDTQGIEVRTGHTGPLHLHADGSGGVLVEVSNLSTGADLEIEQNGTGAFLLSSTAGIEARVTAGHSFAVNDQAAANTLTCFANGHISAGRLPTSSAGLAVGELWVDTSAGNVVKRV